MKKFYTGPEMMVVEFLVNSRVNIGQANWKDVSMYRIFMKVHNSITRLSHWIRKGMMPG